MSMVDWARREVELACKKEAPDRKEGDWDYGCACYESALKAYESLMEDRHSGFSFGVTKQILIRLMEGIPLTPITDDPEEWYDRSFHTYEGNNFHCKRMNSLFKIIKEDGSVTYDDVNRVVCTNIGGKSLWYSSFVRAIFNKMYPITMPYYPSSKHFIVYTEEFLFDSINEDYDHIGLLYLKTPEGERINLNRFFDLRGEEPVEISLKEFYRRKLIGGKTL